MTAVDWQGRLGRVLETARAHAEDVDRRARFPREVVDALGDAGLLGLTVPEELGGLGGSFAEAYEVLVRLAERCASSGMILTMHYAALAVLREAGGGRFDAVLREASAGRHLSTLALSEKATRSSFWISMGEAKRLPDGATRITVDKSFVTSAGPATSYVVSTGSAERAHLGESDLWLVSAGQQGVEVLDWWQGSGLRGNSSAPMRFDCELPPECAVCEPGSGVDVILGTVVPWFQLGACAVSVGVARAAVEFARAHVTGTVLEHLGQRLVDQPVVRHTLGRLFARVDSVDGFGRATARDLSDGRATMTQVLE
ncbi:MAG TPA: acyl-CoA dehydrogenase family protein, partial [Egibacteraceae bacterium]|nr:acyl-CoA dehydrogenase family protein [Egibacteraceae bacterium]